MPSVNSVNCVPPVAPAVREAPVPVDEGPAPPARGVARDVPVAPEVRERPLDLVRLTLDASRLEPILRYEWSDASQDEYPHVYGPIPMSAVISHIKVWY